MNAPDDDIDLLIKHLLATFAIGDTIGGEQEVEDAYRYVLGHFPVEAQRAALHHILLGNAEIALDLVPTAPQLAAECRMQKWAIEAAGFDKGNSIQRVGPIFETPEGDRFCGVGGRDYMLVPMDAPDSVDVGAVVDRPIDWPANVTTFRRPAPNEPKGAA